MYIRLDIVNKKQYETSDDYKEVTIKIPREYEKLKEDFKYLELDYDNFTIQDTHIIKCEFVDNYSLSYSSQLTKELNDLIILLISSFKYIKTPQNYQNKITPIIKDSY